MTYNLTLLSNMSSPVDAVLAVNTYSNNLLGVLILAAVFFMMYRIWSDRGMDEGMNVTYSSFVCLIVGILLWLLELVSWPVLTIPLIVLIFGFMIHQFRS